MAPLEIQKRLLQGFIRNLYDEGFVNDQFYQIQAMKETNQRSQPDYVIRSITNYCISAKNLFIQMSHQTTQANVDFRRVNDLAHDLYERSICIGAENVKLACADLVRASEHNNREQCYQALYGTKNEFAHLRKKFETVVEMERKIIKLSGKTFRYSVSLKVLTSHEKETKTKEGAEFAVHSINTYCNDIETILSELASNIDLPVVDFSKLAEQADLVEKKSSQIGAENVKLSCLNLKQACGEKNKKHFLRSLSWTKNEFIRTQNTLQVIAQMERRIMKLEAKQHK